MSKETEDRTEETVPEVVDVATPEGESKDSPNHVEQAIAASEQEPSITLSELNKITGRNYNDPAKALDSVKHTFDMVGKGEHKQEVPATPQPQAQDDSKVETLATEVTALKNEQFFSQNPELDRGLVEMVASKHGISIQDATSHDDYKGYAEKVKGYDESQSARSVLETNPRLGAVKDSMTEAKELSSEAMKAQNSGNTPESIALANKAGDKAVGAVMDAFDIK